MMPNLMIELQVDRVDLVDEGANSAAFIKLYKRKENTMPLTFEEILKSLKPEHQTIVADEVAKAKAMVPDKTAADLEEANESLKEKQKELDAAKADNVAKKKDISFEEVIKGLDPAMQEFVKTMKAKQDAAEAIAKQIADKAETDMAIAKAKELKSLPVEEAKLAAIIKGVSSEVLDILKAANAAIEGGELFKEVGKGKGGEDSDAWAKIEKRALEVATEQKITKAKAITQVIKDNPEMYKEYLKGGAN